MLFVVKYSLYISYIFLISKATFWCHIQSTNSRRYATWNFNTAFTANNQ